MNRIVLIVGRILALYLSRITLVLGTNENNLNVDNPKINLTCDVSKNWDVLNHNSHFVKNVCISNDYNIDIEPDEEHLTHLHIMFPNIKVVNVDETKKKITIDITAVSIWEDKRVRIIGSKDNRGVRLPSTTKGDSTPVIWNPFFTARISRLKKVRYIFDPTTIQMSIIPRKLASGLLKSHITSAKPFLLGSRIDWSATISCVFDFSSFPFDRNNCLLEIIFLNSNVTVHNNQPYGPEKMDRKHSSEGFDISIEPLKPISMDDPILGVKMHNITFSIAMKRQVGKYIYQYYIPCIAIVTASSFSFIIPLSAIPGRVALMVTQFLTLTNIFIKQMVGLQLLCL